MCTTDEAIARQVAHETEAERLRAALRDLVALTKRAFAPHDGPLSKAIEHAENILHGDH